jgi:hypothetical protein
LSPAFRRLFLTASGPPKGGTQNGTQNFDGELDILFRIQLGFADAVPKRSPHHRTEEIVLFVLDIFEDVVAALGIEKEYAVAVVLIVAESKLDVGILCDGRIILPILKLDV